jgi:hypothetical protein
LATISDAVRGRELIVEIDGAEAAGDLPCAPPPPLSENGFAGKMPP